MASKADMHEIMMRYPDWTCVLHDFVLRGIQIRLMFDYDLSPLGGPTLQFSSIPSFVSYV
jgi:hypothetical protein